MSTGRNALCPCGSGKKFKKCCIDLPSNVTKSATLFEAINKRIAYKGSLGRERKKWCEDYIAWKRDHLKKIADDQNQIVASEGKRITCTKGCYSCCSQHIGASLQECDAIVYWLHQHQDVRKAFLKRYSVWRSHLREHESVFQNVNKTAAHSLLDPSDAITREEFMKRADEYRQLDVMCPFLDNGACSIYPVRPLVCANQVVVSPPDNCKLKSSNVPIVLQGSFGTTSTYPYFRGPKKSVLFSAAQVMVYEIIISGYSYLNKIPGLQGIEDEALKDPKIQSLLK